MAPVPVASRSIVHGVPEGAQPAPGVTSLDSSSSNESWDMTDYSWRQDDAWKTDLHKCMAKVAENGLYLATASTEMQAAKRVVMAAVKQNGHAMAVCSKELKNDEDVVFAAVAQDGDALAHAGETLRNRKDVLEAALGRPFLTKEEMERSAEETAKYCEQFETYEWKQSIKKALEEAGFPQHDTEIDYAAWKDKLKPKVKGRRHLKDANGDPIGGDE
jgi:hypothetical protein